VKFLNVDGSHVGNDEKGLLPLMIIYFIAFLFLTLAQCLSGYFLWIKKSLHVIVIMLAVCLLCMVFAIFFIMLHWAIYPSNGIGCPGCRVFGQLLHGISDIFFATLLLMIASGWAITFHSLPRKWAVTAIFFAYLGIYLILFIISQSQGTSPASTQLVYAAGTLLAFVVLYLLFCWIGVFAYYAFSLFFTFKEETQYDKRVFYLTFGIGYAMWFILPPIFGFISMGVDEWYRPRVVDAFQLTISFIGMLILVIILWPSRVEKYFRIIAPDLIATDATPGETI
jgi:hypothetical protein